MYVTQSEKNKKSDEKMAKKAQTHTKQREKYPSTLGAVQKYAHKYCARVYLCGVCE